MKRNNIVKLLLGVLLIFIIVLAYQNFKLSHNLNNCNEHMLLLNEDLETISDFLKFSTQLKDFESLSSSTYRNEYGESIIQLQLMTISFDAEGKLIKISHYITSQSLEEDSDVKKDE